mgnify:CR=1 FL=1
MVISGVEGVVVLDSAGVTVRDSAGFSVPDTASAYVGEFGDMAASEYAAAGGSIGDKALCCVPCDGTVPGLV